MTEEHRRRTTWLPVFLYALHVWQVDRRRKKWSNDVRDNKKWSSPAKQICNIIDSMLNFLLLSNQWLNEWVMLEILQTREKILWSNGAKVQLFWPRCKALTWKCYTCSWAVIMVKHGGDSITFSSCFSCLRARWMEPNTGQPLEDKLFPSARDLRMGQGFTFQKDTKPEHSAKAMLTTRIWTCSISPDLKLNDNL